MAADLQEGYEIVCLTNNRAVLCNTKTKNPVKYQSNATTSVEIMVEMMVLN